MRTHPDDKLLEQHCYKSAAGLFNLCVFTCVVLYLEANELHRYIRGLIFLPLKMSIILKLSISSRSM